MTDRFPQPPVDAVMPDTAEAVVTAVFAVLVAVLVTAAIVAWRRTGSPVYLLLLIGGAVAVPNEAIVDLLGGVWHPSVGATKAIETFGRPMPVWVVLGYALYFGAFPGLTILMLRKGATRRTFWTAELIIFSLELVWELVFLHYGIYLYYGYQPFKLLGLFPVQWMVWNGLGVLLTASVVLVFPHVFSGRRALLLLGLPTITQITAATIALPYFNLWNAQVHPAWLWVSAAGVMVSGLVVMDRVATATIDRLRGVGQEDPQRLIPIRPRNPSEELLASHLVEG